MFYREQDRQKAWTTRENRNKSGQKLEVQAKIKLKSVKVLDVVILYLVIVVI